MFLKKMQNENWSLYLSGDIFLLISIKQWVVFFFFFNIVAAVMVFMLLLSFVLFCFSIKF